LGMADLGMAALGMADLGMAALGRASSSVSNMGMMRLWTRVTSSCVKKSLRREYLSLYMDKSVHSRQLKIKFLSE